MLILELRQLARALFSISFAFVLLCATSLESIAQEGELSVEAFNAQRYALTLRAEEKHHEAVGYLKEKLRDAQGVDRALLVSTLAEIYSDIGKFKESVLLLEAEQKVWTALPSGVSLSLRQALANAYAGVGDYRQAYEELRRVTIGKQERLQGK